MALGDGDWPGLFRVRPTWSPQGGYSTSVVVTEKFVLHVPDSLPLDATAPLLCAGITVYR
jgi:D-arabinose 1-dehydrogenase-like Zn-dependent alcohol dehydrogenase